MTETTTDTTDEQRIAETIVVGIAGGSASGKSTLATAITGALSLRQPEWRMETLSTDAYFRREDPDAPTLTLSTGLTMFNYNTPESIDAARLVADIDAKCAAPDRPDVLLVEGLLVLYLEPVRRALDVRLFVELDADVRALRRLLRDMKGGRASTDPDLIAAYYLESARVGHALHVEPSREHADLIVRGDADFDRIAPLLAAAIESRRT